MPVYRTSLIFNVTTDPVNPAKAVARSGGWSEGAWSTFNPNGTTQLQTLARLRAAMLPDQCAIIGYRIGVFNIVGNRLQPAGTSNGKFTFPGSPRYSVDVPQAGLEISLPGVGVPNSSRGVLRGLPDEVVINGEFAPDSVFQAAFNRYATSLVTGGFGFVGRDLSAQKAVVNSIAGGVVALSQVLPVVKGDYLRFHRVLNSLGRPISGAFLITDVTAAPSYTCAGLGANSVLTPSGTARKDTLTFFAFDHDYNFGAVLVKKIGRPSRGYRGRRSKMPA